MFFFSATNKETPYEQLLRTVLKNNGSPVFQLLRVKILKEIKMFRKSLLKLACN